MYSFSKKYDLGLTFYDVYKMYNNLEKIKIGIILYKTKKFHPCMVKKNCHNLYSEPGTYLCKIFDKNIIISNIKTLKEAKKLFIENFEKKE